MIRLTLVRAALFALLAGWLIVACADSTTETTQDEEIAEAATRDARSHGRYSHTADEITGAGLAQLVF